MMIGNYKLYKNFFENIPDGILICDSNFTIVESNKAFNNIIKYDKSEFIGKKCSEFIDLTKNSCPICSGNYNSKNIPESFSHIADIKDKHKDKIPVRINHNKFADDEEGQSYYILIVSPLSEIAFLDQAHVDFVSTVSHELRTPLTSIKGFADTILTAGDKLDKEQQKRFIQIIKNQIDRLTRLVENLLTVSRLEAKKDKLIYKSVVFKDFIEFLLSSMSSKLENHKIVVNIVSGLPAIWADSDKLEQILTNLVDNAIKYSYQGSVIKIEASLGGDIDDYVDIKVRDQGVGIPEEYLPKLFTKFSRIDNPLTRQVDGTGLGLYITKSLVESMDGKIFVESLNGETTFTVRLPIATPEKHASRKFLSKEN